VKKEGFPKGIRVKKESEFRRIMGNGIRKKGKNLILFRLEGNEEEGLRFGIKISGGIKKAVDRNRIKRAIREVLRKNKSRFAKNESVVVVCRPSGLKEKPGRLKGDLESLIG
jgi:ribonuclease P protein component